MPGEREYDLVLFGATGFTGGLTADYLAANAPEGLRWALVGRNRAKLEAVAARLAAAKPVAPAPALIEADAADAAALAKVAESTRVVITTVGPYALYGGPLVGACAAAGTDYVDLTGEPEFVDRMWLDHHATAERSGARLVHCCGFDSVPHDLGAYFTVKQLPEGVPLTVNGYVRSNARFSGGTYHSAVNAFGRVRQTLGAARAAQGRRAARRRAQDPARPRRGSAATRSSAAGPCRCRRSTRRSSAAPPPPVDRYGPEFTYGHHAVARHLATSPGPPPGSARSPSSRRSRRPASSC